MSIRQNFKDLALLLKRDRKAQVIAAIVAFMVAWGFMYDPRPSRRAAFEQPTLQAPPSSGAMAGEEAYNDLVTRFSNDLETIKKQSISNAEKIEEQRQYSAQQEERTAEIFKKVLERIADIEGTVANNANQVDAVNLKSDEVSGVEEDTLAPWGDLDKVEVAPPAAPQAQKVAFIGAGDSVRVQLLAGVDAPTDGTPYPVVFKLVSDVDGPDGSALSIGEARLIAAAQGSLSDSRALFRLTHLNVRYPDGSRKVTNVDGWVVGEDGIRGMEGMLIDPIGKALAGSFVAGVAQGAGQAVQLSNQTNVITDDGSQFSYLSGDTAELALAGGLAKAGERWGRFIDDRMRLLVPHVRVFSGREATAVFSQNVELENLYQQLEEDGLQFVSLD
jgi:hypothetical protein